MKSSVKFNSNKTLNLFEVIITIRGKSREKIKKYINLHFDLTNYEYQSRVTQLGQAQNIYADCICYLEEHNDWKAFFRDKNHTNKVVINLRVLSNYFRNIEDFIDGVLIKKSNYCRFSLLKNQTTVSLVVVCVSVCGE